MDEDIQKLYVKVLNAENELKNAVNRKAAAKKGFPHLCECDCSFPFDFGQAILMPNEFLHVMCLNCCGIINNIEDEDSQQS